MDMADINCYADSGCYGLFYSSAKEMIHTHYGMVIVFIPVCEPLEV
jgi:hypothetical protein